MIFIPSVLPPILPILYQIGKNMESWEVWNNKKKDCLMAECILSDKLLLLVYYCNKTRSYKALLFNAGKAGAK